MGRLLQGLGQSVGRDFEGGDPSKLGGLPEVPRTRMGLLFLLRIPKSL